MSRARSLERAALVERMRVVRDDIQEGLFNAVAYWNALHPHEEPIDPDPDGSMRRYLDGLNRALTREDAKRNLTATAAPTEMVDEKITATKEAP